MGEGPQLMETLAQWVWGDVVQPLCSSCVLEASVSTESLCSSSVGAWLRVVAVLWLASLSAARACGGSVG